MLFDRVDADAPAMMGTRSHAGATRCPGNQDHQTIRAPRPRTGRRRGHAGSHALVRTSCSYMMLDPSKRRAANFKVSRKPHRTVTNKSTHEVIRVFRGKKSKLKAAKRLLTLISCARRTLMRIRLRNFFVAFYPEAPKCQPASIFFISAILHCSPFFLSL
jgi:hypothetical protein